LHIEIDRATEKYLPALQVLENHIFKTQGYKTLYDVARNIDIEYAKLNLKDLGFAESVEIDYEGRE